MILILDRFIIHEKARTSFLSFSGQPMRPSGFHPTQPTAYTSKVLKPSPRTSRKLPNVNGMFL